MPYSAYNQHITPCLGYAKEFFQKKESQNVKKSTKKIGLQK
jgi:hypothetical protein